jgi:hypothetical protein
MEVLDDEFMLRNILQYVGDHHFRFVAGVNRCFYQAYTDMFPKKATHYNVNTLKHAKICYDEIGSFEGNWANKDEKLCSIAAGNGSLDILQGLRQMG